MSGVSTEGLEAELRRVTADLNDVDSKLKGSWTHTPSEQEADKLMQERTRLSGRKRDIETQIEESKEPKVPQEGRGREERML